MDVVSIALYMDNPVTSSPLKVPFARLLIFKEYSVANFEIGWAPACHLLGMFESVSLKSLLSYGQGKVV